MGKVRFVLTAKIREKNGDALNWETFDRMLYSFNLEYQDLFHLMREAKIRVKPAGAFDRLLDAGGKLREGGLKLLSYIAYVRNNRHDLERILDHLEESLSNWRENGVLEEELARLALYRTMAHEIGFGENISTEESPLGVRHQKLGRDYLEVAAAIPEELTQTYVKAEMLYMQLSDDIYGRRL
jgi:hypothetical protein